MGHARLAALPALEAGRGPQSGEAGPKDWDRYVENVEAMAETPSFRALRDRVLRLARPEAGERLLDVGAGTGLLALAAAPQVAGVIALDVSEPMCRVLAEKARAAGLENVRTVTASADALPLPSECVDVVVSNYCLHHLTDPGKRRALAEIHRVLRPGGRVVFADMMFRIGVASPRDRRVVAMLVRRMLRAGPRGLVRVLRNAGRVVAGRSEHPAGAAWWRQAMIEAGFERVEAHELSHEGGLARGYRPAAP